MNDELPQSILVGKAQQGDHEALSILIRQHRMEMLRWAKRIVRDSAKAEDIVQDALIQTFRRIGSLQNAGKFVPWLRTLVRNQALMALRSPMIRHELPNDLYSIDERLTALSEDDKNDPFIRAVGSQAMAEMESMLDKLGNRERLVVAAHVLEGLTVAETAKRLGINNGAVYTALSRARTKMADYRFEAEIDRYIESKHRNDQRSIGQAGDVRYGNYAGSYDSLCSMMTITVASARLRGLTISDIFAAAGHAFRFHAAHDLGISGPYSYDWRKSITDGWANLGLSAVVHGGPDVLLQHPDELLACMDDIRDALTRGWPVIAWGLNNAEFGMITGYDDRRRSWSILDTSASGKLLPYDQFGRGRQPLEWFAAIPKPLLYISHRPDPAAALLTLAVQNIRGGDTTRHYSVSGAAAYRLWIDSFHAQQSVDKLSVAYNMAVVAEARNHAAKFLMNMAEGNWYGGKLQESAKPAIRHSAQLFVQIAEKLRSVTRLFPLPYGADPALPGPADRAASLLDRAAALELEAACVLEEAEHLILRQRLNRIGDVR